MDNSFRVITLANVITFSRIIFTCFSVCFLVYQHIPASCFFFIIAAITDFLDGFVARMRNEESHFGALLDPLADKFLFISLFSTLFYYQQESLIPSWFLMLILLKEGIQIIASSFVLYFYGITALLKPTTTSKYTTTALMFLIMLLFLSQICNTHISYIFPFFLMINTCLLCLTLFDYIALFYKKFKTEIKLTK